ncbi:MAG: VWA domain-containing protein [Deltaproteobacteria bacterium]|nr:VWA domain-containing protein [Deltaproteobacteria bacterium]
MTRAFFMLAVFVLSAAGISAQTTESFLLIFDASGSMNEKISGQPKLSAAKDVTFKLLERFPSTSDFGLIIYGHRRAKDCNDIEVVREINPIKAEQLGQLSMMLMNTVAKGETPIAQSLLKSIAVFKGKKGKILLVTDGREECGGDICAAARKVKESGIDLRIDVVGFGLGAVAEKQLNCVTQLTGGRYYPARDAASLEQSMFSSAQDIIGGRLNISVIEGGKGPASMPLVKLVRLLEGGAEDTQFTVLHPNPGTINLAVGSYMVSASVGTGDSSKAKIVEIIKGKATEVTIGVGSGTLVVILKMGSDNLFTQEPVVTLLQDNTVINGVSSFPASFQAQAGRYSLLVNLGGVQAYKQEDVLISAGEKTEVTLQVPAGEVEVKIENDKYSPRKAPYPYTQVFKDGRQITALSDNPARFVLMQGEYEVGYADSAARSTVSVGSGSKQSVVLP